MLGVGGGRVEEQVDGGGLSENADGTYQRAINVDTVSGAQGRMVRAFSSQAASPPQRAIELRTARTKRSDCSTSCSRPCL